MSTYESCLLQISQVTTFYVVTAPANNQSHYIPLLKLLLKWALAKCSALYVGNRMLFQTHQPSPPVFCSPFLPSSQYCVPSQYDRPSSALVLDAARDARPSSPHAVPQQRESEEWRRRRQSGAGGFPFPGAQSEGVLLKSPQVHAWSWACIMLLLLLLLGVGPCTGKHVGLEI